ncbi:thiamine-phosphate kinase [Cyanobium sp. NIES-981]|uniref:thiamine-phosphate kinase n=1 Tax=Cyanobium sp. NIES-981 TaxID=1851505 RepID=UPI0007DDD3D2|nr:thiamine-phosphate kinase [Cyanobium sp. NIES-981]SBO44089.1 Thiamine-monophosphate kinase [Cyanobium sp. NIES-981]
MPRTCSPTPDPEPCRDPTLAELGEARLIERLGAFAAPGQFQDDAAILSLGGNLVVNTDVLVDGVHFSPATTDPFHVGWRAAAANLSDLAAMGCTGACGLTVGLIAPASTPWSWVEAVYQGLCRCLGEHGGGNLLGGDCSSGAQRTLAITAVGALGGAGPIRRGDGRAGDTLVCTGLHGLSRLGLAVLQHELEPQRLQGLPSKLLERAVRAHRMPVPRFDAVRALAASQPAELAWRVAGTDSSDGLAAAAVALALASRCRAVLERRTLPIDPAMARLDTAETWCLAGGEDFELVLALDPRWAKALMELLPGSRRIGNLAAAAPGKPVLGWEDGQAVPVASEGFRHFAG